MNGTKGGPFQNVHSCFAARKTTLSRSALSSSILLASSMAATPYWPSSSRAASSIVRILCPTRPSGPSDKNAARVTDESNRPSITEGMGRWGVESPRRRYGTSYPNHSPTSRSSHHGPLDNLGRGRRDPLSLRNGAQVFEIWTPRFTGPYSRCL